MNEYDVFKSICERRKSVRLYENKAVLKEDIEKIIYVAETSPYVSGKKCWEIIAVNDKEVIGMIAEAVRKNISEISHSVKDDFRDGFIEYSKNFLAFETAPLLLIPTFRIAPGFSSSLNEENKSIITMERDNYIKSISCVCMLILLASESLGYASCYMTGSLIAEKEIGNIIKIKPGRNIGAIIPIGYSKELKNDIGK